MAADDDLDALEAQLEGYDDDEDDDDLPAWKRIWKKFKFGIIPVVALLVFIPVVWIASSGSDKNDRKIVVVKDLAPEPGKQIKMAPDQPGGAQVAGQDKNVFNIVTDGENKGKVAIVAPPEEVKTPGDAGSAITMVPEGAEKTPKAVEGSALPPPTPPEAEDVAALPILPVPGAPAPDGGKKTENILPVPSADTKVPDDKQADKPAVVAVQPEAPADATKPAASTKITTNDNQIAVVIPKAPTPTTTVAMTPPSAPSGKTNVTPMRTMAGVYRVQVASARSESAAKSLWDKQVNKHPDVLGKLPLTVQPAVVQDRGTFYRVQGGAFGDRESADSICRKLKSRGQDCIVVRP